MREPTFRPGQAHRIAYAIEHDYPFGWLRHTCGKRACVNPRHLYEQEDGRSWFLRYASNVAQAGPLQCWEWTGARTRAGYGVLYVGGETRYAHRLAWELARRSYRHTPVITHSCGNRGCVNQAHLEGHDPHNAGKLGERDVEMIRAICATGITQSRVAAHYEISVSMVSRIVNGERWSWV